MKSEGIGDAPVNVQRNDGDMLRRIDPKNQFAVGEFLDKREWKMFIGPKGTTIYLYIPPAIGETGPGGLYAIDMRKVIIGCNVFELEGRNEAGEQLPQAKDQTPANDAARTEMPRAARNGHIPPTEESTDETATR